MGETNIYSGLSTSFLANAMKVIIIENAALKLCLNYTSLNMATFVVLLLFLRHPVTILFADFTNPDNLTNGLLILNPMIINKSLVKPTLNIRQKTAGTLLFKNMPIV